MKRLIFFLVTHRMTLIWLSRAQWHIYALRRRLDLLLPHHNVFETPLLVRGAAALVLPKRQGHLSWLISAHGVVVVVACLYEPHVRLNTVHDVLACVLRLRFLQPVWSGEIRVCALPAHDGHVPCLAGQEWSCTSAALLHHPCGRWWVCR